MTPARMTEPAVGASVWASGNHVWTGNSGTLIAKAIAKPRNSHRAVDWAMAGFSAMATRSNVMAVPASRAWSNTSDRMLTSISAEPNIVYRKNFVAAYVALP